VPEARVYQISLLALLLCHLEQQLALHIVILDNGRSTMRADPLFDQREYDIVLEEMGRFLIL
jgi:hypothetical protein